MSRSANIKRDIINILEDGKEHYAKDIKDKIRRKYIEEVTEGVFAGCFRKLVLEGKCENPERGIYIISSNDTTKRESEDGKISHKQNNKIDIDLKKKVMRAFFDLESEINSIMVDYNLSDTDTDTIMYCLEVRKLCGEIKEKLNNVD